MKKIAVALLIVTVLSVCFSACGNNGEGDKETSSVMSFSEKMSYYDSLANVENDISAEVTDPSALYKISGSYKLVDANVYRDIISAFNHTYPNIYSRYGKEYVEPKVELYFDPAYLNDTPANVVGNTININVKWFNDNPDKATTIVYYIATTVMDYNASTPEWLFKAVNYSIAEEFSATGYNVSASYHGGSYLTDEEVGADFLHWIEVTYDVDIVLEINKILITNKWLEDSFWVKKTGKSLDSLWSSFKAT